MASDRSLGGPSPPPVGSPVPVKAVRQDPKTGNPGEERLRCAYELAERGAVCAARAEAIKVLKLAVQALDAEHQTCDHSRALGDGLRALQEADDFAVEGSLLHATPDMRRLIDSHETPTLKGGPGTQDLSPLLALQSYYMYAETCFAEAGGNDPTASAALTALGRLEPLVPNLRLDDNPLATPKSMVFFRAALRIDPDNCVAGNELAVCLARCGQWEEARELLSHVASIAPSAEVRANLDHVCRRLEEGEQGELAHQRQASLPTVDAPRGSMPADSKTGTGLPQVRWVDPPTFAQESIPESVSLASTMSDHPESTTQETTEKPGGPLDYLQRRLLGMARLQGKDPRTVQQETP